ncbi:hypothetical protein PMAYCL1PPCAC_15475 [Pristionchus mayeri]|uniref:Uncharacterized protein n=1 Tax=Pristionchus mayeri TaxID=1317129 RepID=A0AAN5CJ27_9BILA|nr:hypothetical protein PMAYCL1PPCAC_15475 [Pristionchus mayeri]
MNPLLISTLENREANPVVQRALRKFGADASTSTRSSYSNPYKIAIDVKPALNPSVAECSIDRIIGGLLVNPYHDPRPYEYRLDSLISCRSMLSMTFQQSFEPPSDPATGFTKKGMAMPDYPQATKFWPFVDLLLSIEYMKIVSSLIRDQKSHKHFTINGHLSCM